VTRGWTRAWLLSLTALSLFDCAWAASVSIAHASVDYALLECVWVVHAQAECARVAYGRLERASVE